MFLIILYAFKSKLKIIGDTYQCIIVYYNKSENIIKTKLRASLKEGERHFFGSIKFS